MPDGKVVGICLAVVGNTLISVALTLQKHAHNTNAGVSYWRLPLWQLGFVLMILGEGGNMVAYAYAAASVVAPLGAVSILSNGVIATACLGEPVRRRQVWGTLMCLVGGGAVAYVCPAVEEPVTMAELWLDLGQPLFVGYLVLVIVGSAALVHLGHTHGDRHVAVHLGACALIGSITVMTIKGVSISVRLTLAGRNQFAHALPWVFLVVAVSTAMLQVHYLNKAMVVFGNAVTVPVFYVLFTTASVVAGIVLYREFEGVSMHRVSAFLAACFLTFNGVYLVAGEPSAAPLGGGWAYRLFHGARRRLWLTAVQREAEERTEMRALCTQ